MSFSRDLLKEDVQPGLTLENDLTIMAGSPYVQAHENSLTFCAYKKIRFFFFHTNLSLFFGDKALS